MVFLFTKIEHPAVFKEKGNPEADHILACEYFLLEEILHGKGAKWTERTPTGVLAVFEGGEPVEAALAIQKDFKDRIWSRFDKGKVALVIHQGEADFFDHAYVGPEVNHAQKLLETAWGGQTLLTLPAVHFVPLPPGSRLQDMGAPFLKDLSEPKNVFAIQHADLPAQSNPSLRSLQYYSHNLFPQSSSFFGRKEEIAEITQMLVSTPTRLITLLGPGGFGKTRLALQSAAEIIEYFKDGVFLVPLAPLLSDQLMVGSIANAIRLFFYGAEDPKTQLLNHLREKEMLLIMDNFEHIIEGSRFIDDLLKAAPKLKILVTSREKLKVDEEKVFEVRGMRYPLDGNVEGMESFSAVQLFLRNAKQVRPDFQLKPEDRAPLLRICELLGGMPLGLELAATWVGGMSLPEIAEKIESNQDFLATSMPHLPPRHRSLRAVFEYSWILLPEVQKTTLKAISVFKGGFDLSSARKVAGATQEVLDFLEHKSLLRKIPGGRYEIHELLKYYAKEKLFDDPAEKERALDSHCGYFASLLQKKEKLLLGPFQRQALEEMISEIGNVREAWKRAVEKTKEKEMGQFIGSLFSIFDIKGWYEEAVETFAWASSMLREKYPRPSKIPSKSAILLAKVVAYWARFENNLGRVKKAQRIFEESLGLFRQAGAMKQAGFALNGMAIVIETQGDYQVAEEYYEKGLKAYQQMKDRPGITWSFNNLGHIAAKMNNLKKSQALIQKSLSYSERDKDQREMAYSYNLLGDAGFEKSRFEEGKNFYQKGLAAYLATDDRMGVAWSFTNLGRVAEVLGDFAGARQMYREGLSISREMGNRRGLAWASVLLGNLGWATGDYQEALRHFQEGLSIYREVGDLRGEAWTLDLMGNLRVAMREDQEAERLYLQAFSIVTKEGVNPQNMAWNYFHLGTVSLLRENFEEAKARFQKALGYFHRIGDHLGKAVTFIHLGEIACDEKDYAKCKKLLLEAVDLILNAHSMPLLVDAVAAVARLLKAQKDERKAITLLMMALSHPTCRRQTKDRMVALAMELEVRFSKEEVEGGLRWAKDASIEKVAASWLSANSPSPARKGAGPKLSGTRSQKSRKKK